MKNIYTILILFFVTYSLSASEADSLYENNTAFYEGKTYNYIISPPVDFQMNTVESTDDGYSFAFIPNGENYSEASVIIGINIFKIKENRNNSFSLEKLIEGDTTAIRKHYGKDIQISEVKAIQSATTDTMRTFYFNASKTILPNVMMSYLDGKSEILIFDLSISDKTVRFKAEKIYLECLQRIKALTKGKIDVG